MTNKSARVGRRSPEDRVRLTRGITGADQDILTAEGVAKLLHCTIDAVRRIPDRDLPAHQAAGQYLLYLREDVIAYVKGLPRSAFIVRSTKTPTHSDWLNQHRRSLRESVQ